MTPGFIMKNTLSLVFFTLVAIVVLWAVGRVLAPFITPILLAAIIVTFTHPLYRRLKRRLKGRETAAAVLMLLLVTVTVILPAFVLTVLLIQQATDLFRLIQQTDFPAMMEKLEIRERLMPVLRMVPGLDPNTIRFDTMIVDLVKQIPALVATQGAALLGRLMNVLIGFLMMVLAAFYFYVDGERLVRELRILSPLPDEYDQVIFAKFRDVVDATFRGQILTALAQGAATALGLWITGVPGALFWGAVAALFALIPMLGAGIVWVPATIYLFVNAAYRDGDLWRGFLMAAWGIFVVSLVDNVIRPWAMRAGTKLSAVLLFFAILGGLKAFGFVGLILGPLVFALVVPLVEIYKALLLQRQMEVRIVNAPAAVSESGGAPPA